MNLQYNEELPITGAIQWWGVFLCLYFLSVFEGDADIVSTTDRRIVHQRIPVISAEIGERVRKFLKGFEEDFNVSSLQLHLLKPLLRLVISS